MSVDERSLSTAQIKKEIESASPEDYPSLIDRFISDDRKSVQSQVGKMQRALAKMEAEKARTDKMLETERALRLKGYQRICGIDEVGRGPLAGPVVAAAVIMPEDSALLYVNDSKKLSASKREMLAEQIIREATEWRIGIQPPEVIDAVNILEATKLAMTEAVEGLTQSPDLLLIDAVRLPSRFPVKAVIHGDALCYSIAAASIVAKVYRDRMMRVYHRQYPQYGFDRNMGYGTAEHIAALKEYGPTPIHRRSFINNLIK